MKLYCTSVYQKPLTWSNRKALVRPLSSRNVTLPIADEIRASPLAECKIGYPPHLIVIADPTVVLTP